jgi:uncharacterized protein (TIGR03435 family)
MRKLIMAAVYVTSAVGFVSAQQAETSFEVASIKVNKSGGGNGMLRMLPGGRVSAQNFPVRFLITYAYQLANFQVVGGPSWLMTDGYDVVAKVEGNPAPVVPGTGQVDPQQLAMRNLLTDRFKLTFHRESREMDVFALVMAKPGGAPGPKLTRAKFDCAAAVAELQRTGKAPSPPAAIDGPVCSIMGGPGRFQFGGLNSAVIAQTLGQLSGRYVVDRTGLSGAWDFDLTFAIEGRGGPDQPAADPNAPSLFTAIQEQLGLKLEPTKAPVDVLVIDRIERPTED